MPGLSVHVVDVSRGVVATGMQVEVYAFGTRPGDARTLVAEGAVSQQGLLEDKALEATFAPQAFEAVLHVAAYYRAAGIALPAVPFLDMVTYRFGIAEPAQHYHLPFKCTPWGYSCFRGGA
jgi:5-hydroxyisourate hydrolase